VSKYISGLLDLLCLVIFVAVGRSVHGHNESLGGLLNTAGPFFVGLLVGWVVARAWKNPLRIWPIGVVICLLTALVGQIVRLIVGQGSAVPFVLVSVGYFVLTMLGWRLIFHLLNRISPERSRSVG
jgi:hypothetical protein